jgi:hypothetical protein
MPRQALPFWIQSYEAGAKTVTSERLVNWYLEKNPQQAKFPYCLIPTPGLLLKTVVGDGPIRGMCSMGGDLYVVSGTELYRVTSTWARTLLGVIEGTAPVYMVANITQVCIVADHFMYATDGVILQVLPETDMVGLAYLDGYAISLKRGTEEFFISQPDNFMSWSALDSSLADAMADTGIGIISALHQLFIFGESTTEIWQNTGNASFPFERAQGPFMMRGALAPASIVVADNTVFWLADDYQVYMARGMEPTLVSTPGIATEITSSVSPATAVGFVYYDRGHTHYVLLFSDKTLVFDTTTGLWRYHKSLGLNRWRVSCYHRFGGVQIVGDYTNGNIYELSDSTYTENGVAVRREADSAPIHAAGVRSYMTEVFVDFEAGVGLVLGQGSDPVLMLSWSDDGGRNWSNERHLKMGKIGEYGTQALTTRLGSFRQRSLRIAVSDPINAIITGFYGTISGSAH